MKVDRIGFATCASLVLAACGGDSLEWAGTVTDSAGVTIVANPDQGAWTASSQWTVVEDLLIGTTEGDPDYQFGRISGIGVATDGRIFVLDEQAAEVRVFDAAGVLSNKFGRPGSGPGELNARGSGPLLIGAGDTVFVPDLVNGRVLRFSTDGEALGSYRLTLELGFPVRWEVNRSGKLVTQIRHFPLPGQEATPDSIEAIVERDSDGSIVDTLLTIPAGPTISTTRPVFNFFEAEPAWALSGDGHVFFGVNDEYRIGWYDRQGNLRRVISKDSDRQEVTSADEEIVTEASEKVWRGWGVLQAELGRLKSAISYEPFFPMYLQFLSGPAQSLWVQQVRPPRNLSEDERENLNPLFGLWLGSPDWDVFDSEGRFLGVVTMPERYQPLRFLGDRVYGVWRDELDVEYVMRVRVTGLPGADTGALPVGGAGG